VPWDALPTAVSVVVVPGEELPPLLPLVNEDDESVESILSMDVILSMIILSCEKGLARTPEKRQFRPSL